MLKLYTYMPFNYPWSLPVIVWLLLVLTNITGIRGNQTVLEGDNLHLTCIASGQPEPNITWIKERPGNQGNTVVVQEGKVLTITNINRNDAGGYTCTAYNGFGKLENRAVSVIVTSKYALKTTLTNVKPIWVLIRQCMHHVCALLLCIFCRFLCRHVTKD